MEPQKVCQKIFKFDIVGERGPRGRQGSQGPSTVFASNCIPAPAPRYSQDDPHPEPRISYSFNDQTFQIWGRIHFDIPADNLLENNTSLRVEVPGLPFPVAGQTIDTICSRGDWVAQNFFPIADFYELVPWGIGESFSGPVHVDFENGIVVLVFRLAFLFNSDIPERNFIDIDFKLLGKFRNITELIPLSGFPTLNLFDSTKESAQKNNTATPPDPNCAVSTQEYIQVINQQIAVFTKDTKKIIFEQDFSNFFNVTIAPDFSVILSDPFILYDFLAQRFILTILRIDFVNKVSQVLLAVSKAATLSNPPNTDDWWKFIFDRTGPPPTDPSFPDMPKIGYDNFAYYITGNNFGIASGNFIGVTIFAIRK
jgi:hypothetical protein